MNANSDECRKTVRVHTWEAGSESKTLTSVLQHDGFEDSVQSLFQRYFEDSSRNQDSECWAVKIMPSLPARVSEVTKQALVRELYCNCATATTKSRLQTVEELSADKNMFMVRF